MPVKLDLRARNNSRRAIIRLAALLAALCLSNAAAVAGPVTRTCEVKGWKRNINADPVTLTVDESARTVVTTTRDGVTATFRDGMTAPVFKRKGEAEGFGNGTQFVTIKPDRIEVGYRSPDDETLSHFAYFNRSAIKNLASPCLLRSFWWFGQG
jgi:hypothetical protein